MNAPLILLHDEALRITHPVFSAAPTETRAIFVWDDDYFQCADYSLKRLIFIYETLCELPVEILRGTTHEIVRKIAPPALYVPATNHPLIATIIHGVQCVAPVHIIDDEHFVSLTPPTDFTRFFQYWNKAQKTAFLRNGGNDA